MQKQDFMLSSVMKGPALSLCELQGWDQPVPPHSLISVFVLNYLVLDEQPDYDPHFLLYNLHIWRHYFILENVC